MYNDVYIYCDQSWFIWNFHSFMYNDVYIYCDLCWEKVEINLNWIETGEGRASGLKPMLKGFIVL